MTEIFAPIISAPTERPYVIGQLGQSLDGRIATPTGASRWINGPAALDHLHRLRAHVDAVVVGIGTIIADDPQLTVRRVDGPQPARVIIDPNGRLGDAARCLQSDGCRRFVVTTQGRDVPAGSERIDLPRSEAGIAPGDIADALFARGLKKILIEGGAATIARFLEARALDRIHVLVAPIILGSGLGGLSLPPIASLDEALRPETKVHILDGGDVLFDCDLRRQRRG